MKNLVLSLLPFVARRAKANFVWKTKRTSQVQEQFLRSLLRVHQNTEVGRKYRLREIKTVDQFRQQVPILPYSAYEPYIQRVAQGEQNILTPDPVTYFNLTSGSTGKQKLIPVTRRSRQFSQWFNQVSIGFAIEEAQRHGLSIRKMLLTGSVQGIGQTTGGIEYGPVSAGTVRQSSPLYRQLFAQPYDALQIVDTLARHYVCLLFALQDPQLSVIGATFPILALQICDYLETYAEDLICDLEMGAIAPWLNLEPELRLKLERLLSAMPQRAAELRQIVKTEGRLTPASVWPNLSFVITARGGTSNFYFERFPRYFGNTPVFGGIYASSEAAFGTCYEFNNDKTILAIENAFYEFIPEDQWQVDQPKTLLAEEVKPKERYRILVTNYNGLYRYDIGDVVEVLGFYEKAPLIVFRHRLGGLISSTTEKTTEFHAIQVMQRLQREFNLSLEGFCITLSEDEVPAHYLVNIELTPSYTLSNPLAFLERFDFRLKEIHTSYANKRPEQVPAPRLRILTPGSFATLRQRLMQRGTTDSQLKLPHITEDRQFLAGLTVEQEVRLPEETESGLGLVQIEDSDLTGSLF
jgi:hypothetical protein